MKFRNWFWGLFFILAACLVVFNQLGYLTGINIFTLAASIFLVAILIKSATRLNFGGIFFSFAFLGILYAVPLGIQNLVPWPILIAALFGTIGFSMIFHNSIRRNHCYWESKCEEKSENFDEVIDTPDNTSVNCKVSFGSAIKYVNTADFQRGSFDCSFGAMKVYFDHAQIAQEQAEIYLDISFAGVELYIPKNWKIIDNVNTSLAGIETKNRPGDTNKTIILKGNVKFSGIEIIYV